MAGGASRNWQWVAAEMGAMGRDRLVEPFGFAIRSLGMQGLERR